MMTQLLACCKCCGAQSMWYDVVNSIPCLVILLTICICVAIGVSIYLNYRIEKLKVCNEQEIKKDKAIAEANAAKKKAEEALKKLESTLEEKELKDKIKHLTSIVEEKKRLCESYDILLEKFNATLYQDKDMEQNSNS